jgi:hypothetical protein
MPRLLYVGLKQAGERAFMDKTGIEWFPGSSHDVSDAHAALMLQHADVWAMAQAVVPGLSDVDDLAGLSSPEPMDAVTEKRKPGRPRKDAA